MIMGTLCFLMVQKCGCIDMAIIYHLGIKKGSTTWTVPIYDNTAEAGSAYSYIKYGGKSGYIPLCSTSDSRATGGRVKEDSGSEFAISISGAPPYTKKTYSNPGTYSFTVPAGVTKLRCEIAGAGGGGGSGKYWNDESGPRGTVGGKGGNGNKWNGTFTVSPGNTITITVGSGGAGGSKPKINLSNAGSSGGSSSCNGTTSGGGEGGKGGTSRGAGAAGANSGNGNGGAGGAGGSSVGGAGSRGNNGWVIIEYGMGVQ